MKIYAIANRTRETYGHGDFGTEERIVRQGPYGTGDFPPVFTIRSKAETWITRQEYNPGFVVVELEFTNSEL